MARAYQKGSKTLGQVISSIVEDAFAVAMVGLTLLGVAGVLYKAFKPEGWVSATLESLWQKSPGLVWIAGFGLTFVVLLIKHTFEGSPGRGRTSNFVAYAFVAIGLFFFFKLIITGAL
jgi:hypothetical protein